MSDFSHVEKPEDLEDYFPAQSVDDPDDEDVAVILYAHPTWDSVLIVEDEPNSIYTATDLLAERDQHRTSEFETRKHTVTRWQLDHLSEFDG